MGDRLGISAFGNGLFYCFLEILTWNISWVLSSLFHLFPFDK